MTRPHDARDELTVEQKAMLLSGRDSWTTHPIDDLGIASVTVSDGPHGLRVQDDAPADNLALMASRPATCFPPAVALGSSWDPAVAARVAEAIGREARSFGVDIVLGPGVNIKRSPLCGRNFEYFSEDPLLSGVQGAAYVRALQKTGVGASVKHFAANNQETDRMRVSADVDEQTLREIYLPAFERVVKDAQPATVMSAYNRINGVYASQNRWLLTDVLRGEWGFTGAVVSDWGAVHDPVAAVRAGLDLEMPGTGGRSAARLVEAVRSGDLDETELDRAVGRVLALAAWRAEKAEEIDLDAHHRLARELAAQCAVLLKNDGVLPLAPSTRVAVIGELARTPRFQGGGSSRVNAARTESFLDAVTDVDFRPGYTLDGNGDPDRLRADAVACAAAAEVTVIFAGLPEAEESEGFDRTTLELPAAQIDLIKAVATAAPKTVVVLSNGGIVTLEEWHDDVDAILEGFLLGQAGGGALADLLYGVVNPSGRLAETIPRRLAHTPSHATFPGGQGHVLYGERTLVGYRGYTTLDRPVRYPFGHGLSYTTFETKDFSVEVLGADTAVARTTVANTGERDGSHVVQVYVGEPPAGPVQRPRRELRAFTKVFVPAGQEVSVELPLDRRAFAYWDLELSDWVVTPGEHSVQLGRDSETIEAEVSVHLDGDVVVRELTLDSTFQEWLEHPIVGPTLVDDLKSDLVRDAAQPHILRGIGSLPMQKVVNLLGDNLPAGLIDTLMSKTRR
ncbi:glycoside hydrolase family 3 C-terminal domain-containing protein [Nonomuraea basaltis]|uniref:glycoside hydrolase family 3 C-terminal domain-containing protein n=1 Tax=Nonomuraea basaltis TaxID=2495887 RepID=UPI00110C635C|nr:glycoside hydrolase family 3 C-terminal domain-containing protein [Nonomuraea basaltis]TMR91009.1 beta-glucosidase [Nonomuraea basaltis]